MKFKKLYSKIKLKAGKLKHRFLVMAEKRPLRTFLTVLGLFVLLIIAGNLLRKPKAVTKPAPEPKAVTTFSIGTAPKIAFQAQVEKSGVIQISAQMGGIVSRVNVKDGMSVKKGTQLIALASNYYGGNALSVSRQIAEKQNQIAQDNYQTQKDLISQQREVANQTETNFEKLRDITDQSINDTNNLINFNNSFIASLNSQLQALLVDPVGNSAAINALKGQLSQLQSANLQLNTASRNSQFQTNQDNPPTQLAELQQDITLKQLDIQDTTLDISLEISALSVRLARINEATMFPGAPADGVVQQVLVRPGQQVNPGTPLLIFSASGNQNVKATVYVSREMAQNVSKTEPTTFTIGDKTVDALPTFVSQEAVSGNLYAAIYLLPVENYDQLTDKGYITAMIPVGYPQTTAAAPFIPIDAVYQTQDEALVFVIDQNGKAAAKSITLGDVFGSFVRVDQGLSNGDEVIIDRNVTGGDAVKAQ